MGREPFQNSPLRTAQAISTPGANMSVSNTPSEHAKETSRRASASSLGSMVMVERTGVPTPPPDGHTSPKPAEPDTSHLPPTPVSPATSVLQGERDSAENGMPESGIASITQALRNFVLPKSSFSGKARRHQSLPVSSVTRSTVPAAHISNPTSSAQSSRAHSPPDSPSTQPHISKETNGLTLDAASESREKATPPHTPRALSQEDRQRSPLAKDVPAQTEKPSQTSASDTTLPPSIARGKLAVKISEGKNIKPAIDPYVVCVFEYNEYISKGPRNDRMDIDGDESSNAPHRSIPMRRTDSDMGVPTAIPMRSRQSSTNGAGDEQRLQKVTDPQWDHEAVL